MAALFDGLLAIFKWPVALLALMALPGAVEACARLPFPRAALPLAIGFAAACLSWWLIFRRRAMGTLLATLEHELTHALFAVATFHRIVGMSATWSAGGQVRYTGKGNWLIAIAPYFFPTTPLVVLCLGPWVPPHYRLVAEGLLGAALAYHLISTWRETHAGQPDLRSVGLLFSWSFLPAANLIAYGLVLAHAVGGAAAARAFGATLHARTVECALALIHR